MKLLESDMQLITIINLASYKYKNQKITKEILRKLGKITMSEYLENWKKSYEKIISLKLALIDNEKGYILTDFGKEKLKEIRITKPYWLYKYNSYFLKSQRSKAHKKFCNEVYGDSFSQHGMADRGQINSMIKLLKDLKNKTILELGCGNGLISELIQKETDSYLTGIDLSDVAILYANKNIDVSEKLKFEVGNMNILNFEQDSFDAIIAIDTLYFVDSLEETLNQCLNILKPNGKFAFFYTQWTTKDKVEKCAPKNTDLAELFNKKKISFDFIEFTSNEKSHWRKKIEVLENLKSEFDNEGNQELYEFRYDEASRVVKQNESGNIVSRRYLYFN